MSDRNKATVTPEMMAALLVRAGELGLPPDIQELLIYGNASRGIPSHILTKLLDFALSDVRAQERERCAKIADTGMLTPPDGGSPTQEECDIALNIAAAIRASQDTISRRQTMNETDWVHNDDPLECGVRLPKSSINLWRKPALIADWQAGETLRALATKYKVSHETARKWTECLTRRKGASRRPKMPETDNG